MGLSRHVLNKGAPPVPSASCAAWVCLRFPRFVVTGVINVALSVIFGRAVHRL